MEKLNASEYAEWLREQARLARPFWYGCCYYLCTEELLRQKQKQYPLQYTSSHLLHCKQDIADGQYCADCVGGAIKGAAWTLLGTSDKVTGRLGCPDKSADGMFEYCKGKGVAWGTIATMPDTPCIAVRKAGHVGVYVGGGTVVEWKGFAYGCVETKLQGRGWTHWYKLPWVDYGATMETPKVDPDTGAVYKTVSGTRWRVRAEPNLNGKVLGYVSEPTQMHVFGTVGDWVAVKGGGLKGYISKDALK